MMTRRIIGAALALAFWAGAAHAAISLKWQNSSNTTAMAVTTINVGATNASGSNGSFAAGDLIVIMVTVQNNSGTDTGVISTPTGFTQIDQTQSGQDEGASRMATFYKVATGSESASFAVSWTRASWNVSWVLMDFGGVNTSTPIDAHNLPASGGYSTSLTTTAISPTGAADYLIAAFMSGAGGARYPIVTAPPSGMTQLSSAGAGATSSGTGTNYVAGQQLSASGSTGTKTIVLTGGTTNITAMIALAPAVAAGGGLAGSLGMMGVGQ